MNRQLHRALNLWYLGGFSDGDGRWDGDERDAHADPADPTSTP